MTRIDRIIAEEIQRLICESQKFSRTMAMYRNKFNEAWVLNQFGMKATDSLQWSLINPASYQKALDEFMTYGKLGKVQSNLVYKFMGIMLKNTAILYAITSLVGDFLPYDYKSLMSFLDKYMPSIRYRKIGNNVFPEFAVIFSEHMLRNFLTTGKIDFSLCGHGDEKGYVDKYTEAIHEWNMNHRCAILLVDDKQGVAYQTMYGPDILDKLGFFKWAVLPDGGDAFSDYGMPQLLSIVNEYDDSSTPEKTLVIVNKALDVYHQRSELAAAFIVGGSSTLDSISNRKALYTESLKKRRTHF